MKSPILQIELVDQVFRTGFWLQPRKILHSVSFEVPRGALFGFVGANGAGKTTLIQLIVGIRQPTAGRIRVCGFEAQSREARQRVGYLPERPYFHEHLTGEQTLLFFGALNGLGRRETLEKAGPILERVGLSAARRVELRKYSKGMLQRLGVAQAILHDPEVLVLDEPMSGLDPLGRKEMKTLIKELCQGGTTVFFSSHVIPDVEALCDQVAWIQGGKILGCAPVSEMLQARAQTFEIIFRGSSQAELEKWMSRLGEPSGWKVEPQGEGVRVHCSNYSLADRAVRLCLSEGAQLLEFAPVRPSLEDLFGEGFYRREREGGLES